MFTRISPPFLLLPKRFRIFFARFLSNKGRFSHPVRNIFECNRRSFNGPRRVSIPFFPEKCTGNPVWRDSVFFRKEDPSAENAGGISYGWKSHVTGS
jgi:hypothetical protein